MVPFLQILLLPAISVFSLWAWLALLLQCWPCFMLCLIIGSAQSFLIFYHLSWLLCTFILSSRFFNICFDFTFIDCSNYCQNWTFVLCDNLGGCELCCDFQNWLEFIMWICLAFKISASLLTWWGIEFELLYAIYFSNSGHPQSLISSLHLLLTQPQLGFVKVMPFSSFFFSFIPKLAPLGFVIVY